MRLMRLFKIAMVAFVALCGAPPVFAMQLLVPHRAVYDLSLDKATDKSGITGLTGRMVYEFNGSACDGYTVNFRFVTKIETDNTSRLTDQQTTTYEAGDGNSFSFVTKSYVDNVLDKEVKGDATRDAKGISVKLQKPLAKTINLSRSRFPTQQLVEMLKKAEGGTRFYQTDLFDGSENADRVMDTSVVIGQQEKPVKSDPEYAALSALKDSPSWPVEIAYFDPTDKKGDGEPSYRITFKLHDNGVTRDLLMDYGDFSMRGRLVNLALFKPNTADCTR